MLISDLHVPFDTPAMPSLVEVGVDVAATEAGARCRAVHEVDVPARPGDGSRRAFAPGEAR